MFYVKMIVRRDSMERKIEAKNYLILAVVVVITVILVFYARDWYVTTNEYYAENSAIKDVSREIREDEISNYSLESGKFAIYASSGNNIEIKDFENDFKKAITKVNAQDNILYLNTDEIDSNSFTDNLKDNFATNDKIASRISSGSQATLYVFEEGKITQVFNNLENYTQDELETIMKRMELTNNA